MIPYLITFAWLAILACGTIIHARISQSRRLEMLRADLDYKLSLAREQRHKKRRAGEKAHTTAIHNQYLRDPLVKEMRG